jgi:hypothetical protein
MADAVGQQVIKGLRACLRLPATPLTGLHTMACGELLISGIRPIEFMYYCQIR